MAQNRTPKQVAVIGLGKMGSALAEALVKRGFRARAVGRRHRLWFGANAPLARQRQADRAAYPGHRQVEARRRHLQPGGFHLRQGARYLHLPRGKTLTTTRKIINDDQLLYRASKRDCDICPFKMRFKSGLWQAVQRHVYELTPEFERRLPK